MVDHDRQDAVVIERSFDAPVDLVWSMWTEPVHFSAWYGPPGATVTIEEMDVRVGGRRLLGMQVATPDGAMQMWLTGEYLEIVEHERLVYTESMCDETGRVLSAAEAGVPDGHPTLTEVVVELGLEGGRTTMVLTHVGVPGDSPGAAGWRMALDELADRVAAHAGR